MTGYRLWESIPILVLEHVLVNENFLPMERCFTKDSFVGIILAERKTNKTDGLLIAFDMIQQKKSGNNKK